MYKAGLNVEFASAEYSLKVEYAKNWVKGSEQMTIRKNEFLIKPGTISWVCQKTVLVDTYLSNDDIKIFSEELWINGDC